MKIALISCTKLKENCTCQAKDMYLPSSLFRKARAYIEKNYTEWYILSAKYGIVHPTEIIDTYDMSLNSMKSAEVKVWSKNVFDHMPKNVRDVHFYAGDKYRKYLIPLLKEKGIDVKIPLRGLGIGQQMKWYKENS